MHILFWILGGLIVILLAIIALIVVLNCLANFSNGIMKAFWRL